jgi:hypothetical protein
MTYLKVFTDFRELMEPLSAEEKGRLFEAMLSYAMDGAEAVLEGNERFIWPVARRTIDQEAAAYESKVEANRERARKGAEARWGKGTDSASMPKNAAGMSKDSKNAQEQEQDQEQKEDQYQEHDQEYVYEQPAGADTHIPEREEIEAYCRERKNGIDPDYFYNYYKATGWQVGQNPIRDWKALIQAWEKRDEQRSSGPGPGVPTKFGRPKSQTFDNYHDSHTAVVDLKDIELTLDDEL